MSRKDSHQDVTRYELNCAPSARFQPQGADGGRISGSRHFPRGIAGGRYCSLRLDASAHAHEPSAARFRVACSMSLAAASVSGCSAPSTLFSTASLALHVLRLRVLPLVKEGAGQIVRGSQRAGMLRPQHPLLHRQHLALHLLRLRVLPLVKE